MFILDCSVTMAWCFEDEASAYADAVLGCLRTQTAWVPRLWHMEITNVLLVGERRGRISPTETQAFLVTLLELDIQTDISSPHINDPTVLELGRKHGLSSYDAVYVALALREQLPIATADRKMREAARQLGLHFHP